MKKLMILGGTRYIAPVIKMAHMLNIYVITCDYLPDNKVHNLADKYCNISVIEKEKVLREAIKLKIDGIISFACDPGVVTAAFVAEKMGLPFQGSYKSVQILQDKGLFRQFLHENGFNCPHAKRYTNAKAPYKDIDYFSWPVIVKPSDCAGSKGVSKVTDIRNMKKAIEVAMKMSHNDSFIIEDFMDFKGYHSSADPFMVEDELKFVSYSDQLFDSTAANPYTPSFIIWPTSMDNRHQDILTSETQRLMKLLDMRTGIYNIESCVASDGRPYIMEVSPRGGGCKIAELQKFAYGIDLIEKEVRKAVGMPIEDIEQTECKGYWCEMVCHAKPGENGILKDIVIDSEIKEKYIKVIDMAVEKGDYVKPFTGANMALGDIFLRFNSREQLDEIMSKSSEWFQIKLL